MLKRTAFIIFVTLVLNWLPVKTEHPNLIKHEVRDYDIYDLQYSGNDSSDHFDTSIVLVQIAESRSKIAEQLITIARMEPRVIGLDVFFKNKSDNPLADTELGSVDSLLPQLVSASIIDTANDRFVHAVAFYHPPTGGSKDGYINFPGTKFSVRRAFSPFKTINDRSCISFAARVVQLYSPAAFEKLQKRNKDPEYIHYTGNTDLFESISAADFNQYNQDGQLADKLKGKIVLLGYFKNTQPLVLEDLHFTPRNPVVGGRSFPDMYGVVIQANIIRMILDGKYILVIPSFFCYLLAGLLIFFFLYLESRIPHKMHLLLSIGEIIFVLLLVFLFLFLYRYQVKTPLFPLVFAFIVKGFYKPFWEKAEGLWKKIRPVLYTKKSTA